VTCVSAPGGAVLVIDLDATIVIAHPEKEQAAAERGRRAIRVRRHWPRLFLAAGVPLVVLPAIGWRPAGSCTTGRCVSGSSQQVHRCGSP